MPKPILVIHTGQADPERIKAYTEFMYTSTYTKDITDEYHLLFMHQTAEEKCYILSTDQAQRDIDPIPNTIHRLKEALADLGGSTVVKANPEMLKSFNEALEQSKLKPTLASGGVVSGPSFGNTDHRPEMIVPLPSASQKVKDALKQMHAIRDAARFLIAELKKGWTAKEIAEWYNVPDIKIGTSVSAGQISGKVLFPNPKEAREMEEKSTVKDPNEKASFFGYKIRRSTMQDLESLMLTGGHASFKASDDGEIFITHAFPRGL